jgi:hypothetical protein
MMIEFFDYSLFSYSCDYYYKEEEILPYINTQTWVPYYTVLYVNRSLDTDLWLRISAICRYYKYPLE